MNLHSETITAKRDLLSGWLKLPLMSSSEFVAYVGVADFHDGEVLRVVTAYASATVWVRGCSGREYEIRFEGVQAVEMFEPEGMDLYAISEMRAQMPLRDFVFANNSEDDQKSLGILATGFRILHDDSDSLRHEGFWRLSKDADENLPWPEPDPTWVHRLTFLEALDRVEEIAEKVPAGGFSFCRLCGCRNGSQQLALDRWQWPEGFRHYIVVHQVRPSSEFENFIGSRRVNVAPE